MRYKDFLRNDAERVILERVHDVTQGWNRAESQVTIDPVYPPNEHIAELYRRGLMGMAVAKAYGGLEVGLYGNVLVEAFTVEEIASACGVTSRWFHNHNEALGLLYAMGTAEQRQRFSRAVIDRHVQLAVNSHDLTIPLHALRLTARRGTGGYIINGAVDCVAEAEDATWRLNVAAVQSREEKTHAIFVLIPRNYPGVHFDWRWDLKTPYQSSVSTISYSDCFVPDEYVLGIPEHSDRFVTERSLWRAFSNVGWAALYTGLAQKVFHIGRGCSCAVNGKDNPYREWHIQALTLCIETARHLLYDAAIAVETAQQQPVWHPEAAMVTYRAKTFAIETALAIAGKRALEQATLRETEPREAETYLHDTWTFVLQDTVSVD